MALTCPDCGQETAYVRVGIYVDPHETSVEALSEQVSDIIGTGPEDFDDELPTVCAECECEVPYRLAFAATVRKQAHKNDEEAAMAYRHALAGIVHFFGRLPMRAAGDWSEEEKECHDATVRLFTVLDEAEPEEETSEEE
jgi:hypothetical protein